MSTYDGYAKEYYHKNKERILKKTKKYRQRYNRVWYAENRERILAKLKERRDAKKQERILLEQRITGTTENNP